jgi:hypothetical protein
MIGSLLPAAGVIFDGSPDVIGQVRSRAESFHPVVPER